ncbi:MAG: SDR family oxidoreductase [Thermoleophilia bacterium]|nr:SDR family oxidoreductase [Thermoleophilia bacterium]
MALVVVTGVSSGLGKAAALRFARAGWEVVGTVRNLARETIAEWPSTVELRLLDLAAPDTIAPFAEALLAERGVPDVLVNNAATLLFGSVEDAGIDAIRGLFEVNVFSQIALTMTFVPAMRARGSGLIVNVTSLGGRLVFPLFGPYNASKHAMEGFSEALWHELKPFGIRVKAVEPGYIDTPIYRKAGVVPGGAGAASQPYRQMQEAMLASERSIAKRTSPEDAAEELWQAVTDSSDRLRYPIAAYARRLLAARRLLGDQRFMRWGHGRWFSSR